MKICKATHLAVITFALIILSQQTASSQDLVTVVPEETYELLANPGMGWQTFHRTQDKDKNLPDWIPSTIHYARWG